MAFKQIGQILIEMNALTEEQLKKALLAQSHSGGKKLGAVLIELNFITQEQFMRAYSVKLGVEFVTLSKYPIDDDAVKIISEEQAKKSNLMPIRKIGNTITVATDNPMDFYQLDNLKMSTGFEITPVLATTQDIINTLKDFYSEAATKKVLDSITADFSNSAIADLDKEIAGLGEKIDAAPVVMLANTIIGDAYKNGVSDIHIEPRKKDTRIRVRIDGELVQQMVISSQAHTALITRFKILSDLNIAEKRVPQDGRFSYPLDAGKTLDLRVSSLPTVHGEKMVIRLLGSSVQKVAKLSQLGMSQRDYEAFVEMLKNPNGVIMVTGPTGSGKSTTLYAALSEIATPNINVVTVEDPVEKNVDGINQVHINTKAGLTFAEGLRSILRQDPDVVMIGEIRDGETAAIAVRAAITGHLVLSTIHTNDAISTVSRLVDMGIEPYLAASSLVGLVAQRLVKLLCIHCKKPTSTTAEEMKLLNITEPALIYETGGCEACKHTGYLGRTAIYEMVTVTKELKRMISRGDSEPLIKVQAEEEGATFLRASVSRLVPGGTTDMRQLVRTTYGMDD